MDTTAPTAPPTFSAIEVCQLAGVTYRQLDYWDKTGRLTPSVAPAAGTGTSRRYSSFDVAEARVLGRLSELGIAPGRARVPLPDGLDTLIDHLLVELHALASSYEGGTHDHDAAP